MPASAVAALGVALVAFHNLLDGKAAQDVGLPDSLNGLWVVLHSPNTFTLTPAFELGSWHIPELHFTTGYSLLPWLGVMASGFGFGALYLLEPSVRRRQLLGLGAMLIVIFVAVRFGNAYGDPAPAPLPPPAPPQKVGDVPGPWRVQVSSLLTFFSFINCQKYPPSLLYILLTLGPGIVLLGLLDRGIGPLGRILVVYGRVPLFYYLLHIPILHALMVGIDYLRYGSSPYLDCSPWQLASRQIPPDYGYSLPIVYLVWFGVVVALYPLCLWFGRLKSRSGSVWLSYL
jgi:uncharacterized membrane protein